jgi:hypothetical protein
MRFLLIFLLIAFASSETQNFFYEISCNTRYEFDLAQFPSGILPKANFYFIVPFENVDETNLQIDLSKGDKKDFKLKVSGFDRHPTESEIINRTDYIELEPREVSTNDYHFFYRYRVPTLKKQDKIKYLVFSLLNNDVLHYLSLYVYTSKKVDIEFTAYNITYKKEEILNKTTLSQHKGIFLFILENEDPEKNKLIRLKLKKELSKEVLIGAGGFKERPMTIEIFKNPVSSEELTLKSIKEENYIIYESLIEKEEINKQKYIAIAMFQEESLDFISFYIGPES